MKAAFIKIVAVALSSIFSLPLLAEQVYNSADFYALHYQQKDIDLNNDGILDKLISSKKAQGNELYFFVKKNNVFTLAYKGSNFSNNGNSTVTDIKTMDEGDYVLSINTASLEQAVGNIHYEIAYQNNDWYLNRVTFNFEHQNDPDDWLQTCEVHPNKTLNSLENEHYSSLYDFYAIDKTSNLFLTNCRSTFDINHSLSDFIERVKTGKPESYKEPSRYSELLKKYPLTKSNLVQYNNLAYYLQEKGANDEARQLLSNIIHHFPNRTVAYYNLGDAYWAMGAIDAAKKSYHQYVHLMVVNNKQNKIPKRVLERIESDTSKPILNIARQENSLIIRNITRLDGGFTVNSKKEISDFFSDYSNDFIYLSYLNGQITIKRDSGSSSRTETQLTFNENKTRFNCVFQTQRSFGIPVGRAKCGLNLPIIRDSIGEAMIIIGTLPTYQISVVDVQQSPIKVAISAINDIRINVAENANGGYALIIQRDDLSVVVSENLYAEEYFIEYNDKNQPYCLHIIKAHNTKTFHYDDLLALLKG